MYLCSNNPNLRVIDGVAQSSTLGFFLTSQLRASKLKSLLVRQRLY